MAEAFASQASLLSVPCYDWHQAQWQGFAPWVRCCKRRKGRHIAEAGGRMQAARPDCSLVVKSLPVWVCESCLISPAPKNEL